MSKADGKKRLVRSRSGLRIVNLDEGKASPFELREPFWVPDEESPSCSKCQAKFDFLTRRHHCRRCGNVYCKHCCDTKLPLPRMCFVDPVRICEECVDVTKKENDFYDKHLKVLLNGAHFFLNEENEPERASYLCSLSHDHQIILFDGGNTCEHCPVSLSQITSLRVLTTGDNPGSTQIVGANIKYKDSFKEEKELCLYVATVPNRKQSATWISALQKALKLLIPASRDL